MIRRIAALLWLLPLAALAATETGRIHALAAAPGSAGVLVASERGLFLAQPDGRIIERARREGGFSALAADPADAAILYASGPGGGLLRSADGGSRWQRLSEKGPGAFTKLAVGPTKSGRLYGVADALYRSSDGGRTWQRSGAVPGKLISFTASARDPARVYAGTENGLLASKDGGAHWEPATMYRIPVSMLSAGRDGTLYSFHYGQGLLRTQEPRLAWTVLGNGFGGQAIMNLARDGQRLYASTNVGKLFASTDGGRNWQPLAGVSRPGSETARRGEKLFAANCQGCHGARGIGEAPQVNNPQASLAPALDETQHAWHHTDEQLATTILKGLPEPSRMKGWEGRLSPREAGDLVAYVKSLWDDRALRCQGPKHMTPGCQQ